MSEPLKNYVLHPSKVHSSCRSELFAINVLRYMDGYIHVGLIVGNVMPEKIVTATKRKTGDG